MHFYGFFDYVLGSRVKARLVEYLLQEEPPTSEREISRIIGISNVAASKGLKELFAENLLQPTRIGNITAWYLNKKSYAYDALAGKEKGLAWAAHNPPIIDLSNNLDEKLHHLFNNREISKIVIYGSVAKGTATTDSDIDLFIEVFSEGVRRKLKDQWHEISAGIVERYGNKLSPNIMLWGELEEKGNEKIAKYVREGIKVL